MKTRIHYVYLTTNLITGEQYIGDHTINPHDKKYYIGSGILFNKKILEYGEFNFFKEILEWFPTRNKAFIAQEKYIKKFNTLVPNGYNISPTGGTNCGGLHSKETKKKIRNSLLGEKHPAFGKSTWMKGRNHTEEAKQKMREAKIGKIPWNKGLKYPEEVRKKMSEMLLGEKNPNWGKHLSEETKQKIRENNKGKHNFVHTEEAKIKISLNNARINLNKKLSEETRRKLSESHLGKKRGKYKTKINIINGK